MGEKANVNPSIAYDTVCYIVIYNRNACPCIKHQYQRTTIDNPNKKTNTTYITPLAPNNLTNHITASHDHPIHRIVRFSIFMEELCKKCGVAAPLHP